MTRVIQLLPFALLLLPAIPAPAFSQSEDGNPWVVSEQKAKAKSPLPSNDQTVARGRDLYQRECASCHGKTGDNDGPKAPKEIDLGRKHSSAAVQAQSDGTLFWKITEGRGKAMPTMGDELTEKERWAIVVYMRTLASSRQ